MMVIYSCSQTFVMVEPVQNTKTGNLRGVAYFCKVYLPKGSGAWTGGHYCQGIS